VSRTHRAVSPAQTRQAILRQIRTAIQPAQGGSADPSAERTRLAYVCESLRRLSISVEETACAWEGRGYWTKADRFRREWAWVGPALGEFEAAAQETSPARADPAMARLLVRLIQLGVARPGPDRPPSPDRAQSG
jgi:hypothetical protein